MNKKISISISVICILSTLIVGIYKILDDSKKIILHWDFAGNTTNYGNKYLIILLPMISIVLSMILMAYDKNPFKFNRPYRITLSEKNVETLRAYNLLLMPTLNCLLVYVTLCACGYVPMSMYVVYGTIALLIFLYILFYKKLEKK